MGQHGRREVQAWQRTSGLCEICMPVVRLGAICEHNRQKSKCKACGCGAICKHNREMGMCKACGGGGICKHNRQTKIFIGQEKQLLA